MPLYEYKCVACGQRKTSQTRANRLDEPCSWCGYAGMKRVFGFAMQPVMHEHYNHAVGGVISDMGQFKDELKRKSDEASAQTGIEHRFAPVDMGDPAAVGATNEGIHESNVKRSRIGAPLLPDIGA